MQSYYKHLPELDGVKWTNYFLNDFMPQYNFYTDIKSSAYNYVMYDNKNLYPRIVELDNELQQKYNFPPISYFMIFLHNKKNQPIHVDGTFTLRYASLNLPISGYENTKMIFYKKNNHNANVSISNANYLDIEDLTFADEFNGSNDWVLVNSGEPHQIVNIDVNNPRITVCFRFQGNLKFEDLIQNAKP